MVINNGASPMGMLVKTELIPAKLLGPSMAHREKVMLVIILSYIIVFLIITVLSLRSHLNHGTVFKLNTMF